MDREYTFGDTELAAQRLAFLTEVFAEPSRAFVLRSCPPSPSLVVDLGCGPGCCTRFLADLLQCEKAVGLDRSEHFLSLARREADDRLAFFLHDVTTVPFPVAPADVIFARFVLAHLPDAARIVPLWGSQLAPGGRLLLEEPEWIRPEDATLAEYLGIVEAMLADRGSNLYVGPHLHELGDLESLKRVDSRVEFFPVPLDQAARMFAMNIQTWKHNDYVKKNVTASRIEAMQRELLRLSREPAVGREVAWGLRQIAYEKES